MSAFRVLKNGNARQYTATTFPRDPWRGCEHMIRMGKALGCLRESGDGYAVLDVLNENGDIVQDYSVPDAQAWEWVKRKLNFAVESSDDDRLAGHRKSIKVASCFPTGTSSRASRVHAVREDERTFCGRPILGWEYGDRADVNCALCIRSFDRSTEG